VIEFEECEVEEWIRVLGFEFGGREGECVNMSVPLFLSD